MGLIPRPPRRSRRAPQPITLTPTDTFVTQMAKSSTTAVNLLFNRTVRIVATTDVDTIKCGARSGISLTQTGPLNVRVTFDGVINDGTDVIVPVYFPGIFAASGPGRCLYWRYPVIDT